MMKIVGVVGSGTMGGAIAHQAAISGFTVILRDVEQRFLDNALARMQKLMDRQITKGKITEEQKADIIQRITFTTSLEDMGDCGFVIEAIIEDLEAKKEAFRQLDEILGSEAIIASNTSSMSITDIAAATKRPHLPCSIIKLDFQGDVQ